MYYPSVLIMLLNLKDILLQKDPGDVSFWRKVTQSCVKFNVKPEDLRGTEEAEMPLPSFSIVGQLFNTICDITKPFSGEVILWKI